MHPIVVQKYGGSSVADVERLGKVADRVLATVKSGKRVVVVVSAMGKTTDELIALAKSIAPAPPRRELDMLLSTGERISMALLAMALETRGLSAISFTGSQSGILTNDRHSGARIIEVRPVRIEDELDRDRVVIIAGFQGMSYRREITTLGRGGSDTTAVAMAAALSADCEIYSDVDGVYSADPKVVTDAKHLAQIGYEEMQELAEHGAKVLNAQAVEWARKAQITIYARATSGSTKETKIGPEAASISSSHALTGQAIAVTGQTVMKASGPPEILRVLAENHVTLRSASPDAVRFCLSDIPDWPRVERLLHQVGAVCAEEGQVSAVGPGVGSNAQILSRVLEIVGQIITGYEASPLRLTLHLPKAQISDVTRAIHAALC